VEPALSPAARREPKMLLSSPGQCQRRGPLPTRSTETPGPGRGAGAFARGQPPRSPNGSKPCGPWPSAKRSAQGWLLRLGLFAQPAARLLADRALRDLPLVLGGRQWPRLRPGPPPKPCPPNRVEELPGYCCRHAVPDRCCNNRRSTASARLSMPPHRALIESGVKREFRSEAAAGRRTACPGCSKQP